MAERAIRQPLKQRALPVGSGEVLMAGDLIEYSITVEISPTPGSKAWIKFGTTAQVRPDETTDEAERRIVKFVDDGLDRRIAEASV